MQERFKAGSGVEVAALAPQRYVREEAGAEEHMLAQLRQLGWGQRKETIGQHCSQANSQCRKDASDAPPIKGREREAVLVHSTEKYRRDQEARNDEEDVYAHIAAADYIRKGVIENY